MTNKKRKQVAWGYVPYIQSEGKKKHRLNREGMPKSMVESMIKNQKDSKAFKYGIMKVPVYEDNFWVKHK
jgi:hypothetical protein